MESGIFDCTRSGTKSVPHHRSHQVMLFSYLTGVFADKETVARTSDILSPGRRVPDGRGFVAVTAFHNVLFSLARDIDGIL